MELQLIFSVAYLAVDVSVGRHRHEERVTRPTTALAVEAALVVDVILDSHLLRLEHSASASET